MFMTEDSEKKATRQHLSPGPGKILYHLLNGNLEVAAEEAVDSNYPHLACALSTFRYSDRTAYRNQASGDDCFSPIMHWNKTKESKFISEDLLKIYLIMAGEMHTEINGKKIFVNEGLDGLRAFAVFVWYYEPFDAPLKEVFHAFENDLAARKATITLKCDMFYELLHLACDPSYPMEVVLEPT
ncbi:unnamed protein product, partial [Gongylonema pulchrum]|uniref:Nup96 domain-containing protein n=1 Tax=Gongylonema pulchrum TaxID=637853 RepID=A0A183DGY2_9BILA